MRLRLHPVSEVLAGIILFRRSEAQSVLCGHAEILSSAPDELSVLAGLISMPDGSPVVFINLNSEFEASSSSSRIPIVSQSD